MGSDAKKDAIYMKPDFNEEDGLIAADVEVHSKKWTDGMLKVMGC